MQALPATQPIKYDELSDLKALIEAIKAYNEPRHAGLFVPIPYPPFSEVEARLETMLNRYIDNRIAAALAKLNTSDGKP